MIRYIVIEISGPHLPSCHMCITCLLISQFSASWFRVAVIIAFSNCSLSITHLSKDQPRFLTVDMALTCVLVLLGFQDSPRNPLILPINQSTIWLKKKSVELATDLSHFILHCYILCNYTGIYDIVHCGFQAYYRSNILSLGYYQFDGLFNL